MGCFFVSKHSKKMISAAVIARFQEIFRCPVCSGQMQMINLQSLICSNRHCFDIAKQGYVNLLSLAKKTKYDKGMFEYRRMINRSGFFDPLNAVISDKIINQLRTNEPTSILDAVWGKALHLTKIQEKLFRKTTNSLMAVGIDISKEGISSAAAENIPMLFGVLQTLRTVHLLIIDSISFLTFYPRLIIQNFKD